MVNFLMRFCCCCCCALLLLLHTTFTSHLSFSSLLYCLVGSLSLGANFILFSIFLFTLIFFYVVLTMVEEKSHNLNVCYANVSPLFFNLYGKSPCGFLAIFFSRELLLKRMEIWEFAHDSDSVSQFFSLEGETWFSWGKFPLFFVFSQATAAFQEM